MPELEDVINSWEKLGCSYWQYDQTAYLKRAGSVTTFGGIDSKSGSWEKPVTRDVSGGICHALSLRFVEGRMVGLGEEDLWKMLKGSFTISKLQQSVVYDEKSGYMAGGNKGKKRSVLFGRPVNSQQELVNLVVGSPNLYVYSMWSAITGEGHSVAFDTRDQQFWFFDANSGMYVAKKKSAPTQDKSIILSFIYGYWASLTYNQMFHNGSRELTKYK